MPQPIPFPSMQESHSSPTVTGLGFWPAAAEAKVAPADTLTSGFSLSVGIKSIDNRKEEVQQRAERGWSYQLLLKGSMSVICNRKARWVEL